MFLIIVILDGWGIFRLSIIIFFDFVFYTLKVAIINKNNDDVEANQSMERGHVGSLSAQRVQAYA
jgi:hypothetical protein